MPELSVQLLLNTETVAVRDVVCGGECRHRSAEECAQAAHLVFPYRGVYVRHLGGNSCPERLRPKHCLARVQSA